MQMVLKDGTTYTLLDNSTALEVIMKCTDLSEFTETIGKLSDENLSEFTINNTKYENRKLAEAKLYFDATGMEAHFVLIPTEAQAIIDAAVARYADKANGYDILTGGV